MEMIIE